MAPPFRVDTEDSVEIGARQDPAAYCGSHGERSLLPLAEDERVDTGTSRDGTTPRRHAASLHQQSDSSSMRPTSQAVTQQIMTAQTNQCPTACADNDCEHDDTDGLILEVNEDTFDTDQCPHARGDLIEVSDVLISVEASIVQYRINFDPDIFEDAETRKEAHLLNQFEFVSICNAQLTLFIPGPDDQVKAIVHGAFQRAGFNGDLMTMLTQRLGAMESLSDARSNVARSGRQRILPWPRKSSAGIVSVWDIAPLIVHQPRRSDPWVKSSPS